MARLDVDGRDVDRAGPVGPPSFLPALRGARSSRPDLAASTEYAPAGEVPIRIGLTVTGTAGEGAPDYVESEEPPATAPPATAPPADDTAAGADPAGADSGDEGGLPLWGWLLAALVVLGLALVLLTRRTVRR